MLRAPEFWVAVAFVIFIAIVWRMGAFSKIFGGLDARTNRVRAELDEAKRLRAEAQATLTEYENRRAEAEREAQAIVAAARDEAERVGREARERLTEFVKRRTEAAEARIAQAESEAEMQVRAAAAETAVRAAEIVLRDQLRGPGGDEMLRRSLGEVRGKLHS